MGLAAHGLLRLWDLRQTFRIGKACSRAATMAGDILLNLRQPFRRSWHTVKSTRRYVFELIPQMLDRVAPLIAAETLMKRLDRTGAWDPIITTIEAQFEPAVYDAELVECLGIAHADTAREFRRSAPRFVFGVRNEAGELYRRIGVFIAPDAHDVRNWFVDGGFVDEIGDAQIAIDGCHHIFRRRG
jgi:hypothetical protein